MAPVTITAQRRKYTNSASAGGHGASVGAIALPLGFRFGFGRWSTVDDLGMVRSLRSGRRMRGEPGGKFPNEHFRIDAGVDSDRSRLQLDGQRLRLQGLFLLLMRQPLGHGRGQVGRVRLSLAVGGFHFAEAGSLLFFWELRQLQGPGQSDRLGNASHISGDAPSRDHLESMPGLEVPMLFDVLLEGWCDVAIQLSLVNLCQRLAGLDPRRLVGLDILFQAAQLLKFRFRRGRALPRLCRRREMWRWYFLALLRRLRLIDLLRGRRRRRALCRLCYLWIFNLRRRLWRSCGSGGHSRRRCRAWLRRSRFRFGGFGEHDLHGIVPSVVGCRELAGREGCHAMAPSAPLPFLIGRLRRRQDEKTEASTMPAENPRDRRGPPGLAILRGKAFLVEHLSDLAERHATTAKIAHAPDAGLLARILNQRAVFSQVVAVTHAANPLTL